MRAIKYLTAIWAFVYSCICYVLSGNASLHNRFTDDLFMLIVFSGLAAAGIILNIKSDVFNYVKAVASLWFPVSAIFHWLTINEWTKWNFYYSMIYIVASVLFAFTQFTDCFERKNLPVFHYIYLPMAVVFILSMLDIHYNDNTLSSLCMTVYVPIMLSQAARHWYSRNDSTNSEEEYIRFSPTYNKRFFKALSLVLMGTMFFSATYFFANINLLTKLTRPSAYEFTTETFMPLPGLIWLIRSCFYPDKTPAKTMDKLLFTQSALIAAKLFFSLRPEYFPSLLTGTTMKVGILALLFFAATYCYYAFHTSKAIPVLIGIVYIIFTCSSFVTGSYPFDEMTVAMLVNVFAFVCTVIGDCIEDRKFEKELEPLLERLKEYEQPIPDDEPDYIDED